MTRIVAGTAGGRTLQVPRSGTRPTSERVREALFSRLEHAGVLAEARVLDLYAGSGALGLEAASRGARRVTLVEAARTAAQLCRRNAASLGLLEQVDVVTGKVQTFLRSQPTESQAPVHLALLDPPYEITEAELGTVLGLLATGTWLAPDALVVVERSRRSPQPPWPGTLERVDQRTYGDTAVWSAAYVP